MERPRGFDTRTILRSYAVLGFIVGIAVMVIPWPEPASLATARITRMQVYRNSLAGLGSVLWLSGLFARRLADIEDPLKRRGALRLLASTLLFTGTTYFAPAWPVLRQLLPATVALPPLAAGVVLFYLSLDTARRRTTVYTGTSQGIVLRERAGLTGRYEEQIRQAARQEERARLARDLHDAVKQQLFVIQTAAATVGERFNADPAGAQSALGQVRASARDALSEMEVMLEQLQAAPITNAGLIDSLKRQCEVLAFRTGADVQFQPPASLPPEAAFAPGAHQAMVRFAQEALANVARHARASHVTVTLRRDQKLLVLSVADDGQGFDATQPPRGMGLTSMSARATEADGVFSMQSAPGSGTTVSLTIQPYAPDRSGFLRWIIGSALMLAGLAYPGFTTPASLVYVIVGAAVSGTVLVDNALAWWRAREWP